MRYKKRGNGKAFCSSHQQGLVRLSGALQEAEGAVKRQRNFFALQTDKPTFVKNMADMSNSNTVSELVHTAQELSDGDFERFYEKIQHLHAQKVASGKAHETIRLLKKLTAALPRRVQMRWDYLIARRDTGAITEEEYAELIHLTETIEKRDLMRLKWMAKLSEISRVPLSQIPQKFGLQPK